MLFRRRVSEVSVAAAFGLVTGLALSGCAAWKGQTGSDNRLLIGRANAAPEIRRLVDSNTFTGRQLPIEAHELCRLGGAAVQLVRVSGAEELHEHPDHDLIVLLLGGDGSMTLGDQSFQVRAGDLVVIEHGTKHAFRNEAKRGSLAIVVRVDFRTSKAL